MLAYRRYKLLESLDDLSKNYSSFVTEVYKGVSEEHLRNFVVCPFSIHAVFGFLYCCGEDETAKQISSALYIPNQRKKIPEVFKNRIDRVKKSTVNSFTNTSMLCLKQSVNVKKKYKKIATDYFGAHIYNANFVDKMNSAKEINELIKKKTQNKIKSIVEETDIADYTNAMLISAASFTARWRLQFPKSNTKERCFFINKFKGIFTDMMEVTDYFNYSKNRELQTQFLEIPFEESDLTMTLVLPSGNDKLADLEDNMETILKQSHCYQKVSAVIPKFKIEATVDLKSTLRKMGISNAFKSQADFTKITDNKTKLKINSVIQKSKFQIEETGEIKSSADNCKAFFKHKDMITDYETFIADHPFIYFIKDSVGILFIGRFCEPSFIS